ncbi:MAG: hypothetical protein AAFO83_00960 [Cyanobacteria bacterium J06607_13]
MTRPVHKSATPQASPQALKVLSDRQYGDNCKKLITSCGLRQSDVAGRMNLTKDALWKRLEGQRGRWDMDWLTRIAIALDMPIGDVASAVAGVALIDSPSTQPMED